MIFFLFEIIKNISLIPASLHSIKILSKIDLRRIGDPLDIASAIYFLSEASYITGQVLKVDGGRS